MQIDGEVVATARQLARHLDVVRDPRHAAPARDDDQVVDVWIGFYDRCGVGLHHISDVSLGVVPPECAEERRREDHVADGAQSDEQDAHYSLSTVASSISITGMSSLMG